jgi:type IV secretion system protein VirD4
LFGEGELLLGLVLGLAGLLLGATEGAGLVLTGRPASIRTAARVLVDALRGVGRLTWPPAHHVLSRTSFLVWLAVLSAVVLTAVVLAARVVLRRRSSGAGFAERAEVVATASLEAARRTGRVTRPSLDAHRAAPGELGYRLGVSLEPRGVELWASWEHSLEVVAPPGAGKTYRVLGPILRQHPGPALATSTKSDLYEATVAARRAVGPVLSLDPEGLCPGAERLLWSPIGGCEDARVAERRASALVAAAGEGSDVRGGGFFRRSAAAVLSAYLHAAALEGCTMRDVLAWSARPSDPAPARILVTSRQVGVDWGARLAAHTTGAEETTSGVMRTVDLALGCFSDPGVLSTCAVAPGEGVDLGELLRARGTLFALGKDRGTLGGSAPLVTALCDEWLTRAERLAVTRPGRRLDPPLLACLDEVAAIAPLPGLPGLLADGRGRGITTVVALQSFSQAVARWGAEQAATMRNAASILLVFGGLAVASDLEELSRLSGKRMVERASLSLEPGRRSRESVQLADEPVCSPAELHALAPGTALCLWGRLPPMLVRLPALFEGRGAAAFAAEEAAARAANDAARLGSAHLTNPSDEKEERR